MNKDELKKAMQTAQKLQLELLRAQEELSEKDIEGVSENNLVHVTISTEGQYKSLKIQPSLLKFAHNIIEESVLQAISDANQKAAATTREKLLGITKQIGL